jgi:glycosyltransferase involved in cell wall biosynthesis
MVLTSNNEGTPVSLIEAQVSRLPIVSTNVGGIQDIVIPNKTALLSSRGDVGAMVKNILFLMENPAYLFEMKKHGRDFVVKHFSYELLVERMRNLYFDLLLKKGITITRGEV